MKKSDLQNGMVVEKRNGSKRLIIINPDKYEMMLVSIETGVIGDYLRHYDDNLFHINGFTGERSRFEFDIVKVYKDYTCQKVLWERKETPELSAHDKYVLKGLDRTYYDWYIGRDSDGDLVLYNRKPFKRIEVNTWFGRIVSWYPEIGAKSEEFNIYKDHFANIKWQDDEIYTIRELLGE